MELLITGAWKNAKDNIEEIKEKGHRVHFLQFEKDELPCPAGQIEGVICNGLFLYHNIEEFHNLRYIQLTSAGFDRVPMDYIRKHDISIYNAGEVYGIPMAEFAIAGVLSIYKKTGLFRENQRLHKWEKQRDLLEINGKTVCVFGCGNVGRECAKRFGAFGARVVGVKKNAVPEESLALYREYGFEKIVLFEDSVGELACSDIVISTIPISEENRHFFNAAVFSAMKRGALFVNISRGGVVDTEDLITALISGQLSGAVLDVYEEEPLSENSKLWDMESVILTPHNSFVGDGNQGRLWNLIKTNIQRGNGC